MFRVVVGKSDGSREDLVVPPEKLQAVLGRIVGDIASGMKPPTSAITGFDISVQFIGTVTES